MGIFAHLLKCKSKREEPLSFITAHTSGEAFFAQRGGFGFVRSKSRIDGV